MGPNSKKLTVHAYSDKRLQQKSGEFVLPVNPEKYEQTFKIDYDVKAAPGSQGTEGRFKSSAPEELQLEFLFDGTNTVYGYGLKGKTVERQLSDFKNTVYKLQGEIHQPRYLKLIWKDFVFNCILREMKVSFTLFNAEGTPLRARLNCTFLNYIETERRVREEGKSSPDLTHMRDIRSWENLPLLTNQIYGSPNPYLEVALSNNLTSFRGIKPDTPLIFPPIEKIET